MAKATVLKITKADKTVHVVPVTHKAFYQHLNNKILPADQQMLIEEIDEDEAKDLPLVDDSYVIGAEATEQNKSLKKQNEALLARIQALEAQQSGALPMGHGQTGPVGHVGGDPATATEGAENTGKDLVPPANPDEAGKSADATTRVVLDQNKDAGNGAGNAGTDEQGTAKEVIEKIKAAKTIEEVNVLVKGDGRKTVNEAAEAKIAELSKSR